MTVTTEIETSARLHADAKLLPPLKQRTIEYLWQRTVLRAPGHVFLVADGQEFTFAESEAQVTATASALRSGGVRAGVHVGLLLQNSPEYVWLLLAIGRIGAIGVPVHAEAKGQLLRHFFRSTDVTHAVVAASHAPDVASVLDAELLESVWIVPDGVGADAASAPSLGKTQRVFDTRIPSSAEDPDHGLEQLHEPRFKDDYLLMFTSGTTGPSKAALVTQAQPITHALRIAELCGWTSEERFYTCLPLSHANAQCHTMLPAIALGATMVLDRRFSVTSFWTQVASHRVTAISLLGSMLQLLTKKTPLPEESDNDVSTCIVVPFPRNVAELDARYRMRFATLYGLTECAPVSFAPPGDAYARPAGMAGRVLREQNDVLIVDDDDVPVATGTTGEIIVRRHEPFITVQRYYGRERETWADFRNQWFHTGDFGYLDNDDYLYFVGRKSDSLRRRGENVSVIELEDMIQQCEDVLEAAVVAVPSDLGEMSEDDIAVFLRVQPGSDLGPEGFSAWAASHLPKYMCPRYIRVVEAFEMTPTSKIRKDVLRKETERGMRGFLDTDTRR